MKRLWVILLIVSLHYDETNILQLIDTFFTYQNEQAG